MVICPAVLREKWQDELERRMGVKADIVDAAELLRVLKRPESAERGFALISSLQGLRPRRGWDDESSAKQGAAAKLAQFLQERENDDNLIDLLVIDEAHYLRNPETRTNLLGRLFRSVAEYVCFLTATPVHNKNMDLFSVLNILDPDTFRHQDDFETILQANAPLVSARDLALSQSPDFTTMKQLIEIAQLHPLLKGNRQLGFLQNFLETSDLSLPENRSHVAYRLETVNLLSHTVTRTRKREVKEWRVVREPIDEAVRMNPDEERFYNAVTEIVHNYSLDRDINAHFLLATPQRLITSCMPAALRSWQRRRMEQDPFYEVPEDGDEQVPQDELGPLTERLASMSQDLGPLDDLISNDGKYKRLVSILSSYFGEHPDEKVVLFSSFRGTIAYLAERLEKDQISTITLVGGGKISKDEIIKRFSQPGGPRVLLSSEVGGEGVDLQFCRVIVNYDLPWNPMRVEQRIGRIDRLGQKAEKVTIWNLFYEGTIDARIYQRLYKKLDLCRHSLGDFEAILSDQIRTLTADLLRGRLSAQQQEARIDQTALALDILRRQEEELEQGASQLLAYGDYILNQIKAARDLHRWIGDNDLKSYVLDFLRQNYPGGTYHQTSPAGNEYDILLETRAKHDIETFIGQERLSKETHLTRTTSSPVRCRFQNKVSAAQNERVEIISQFHPLVRFVSEQINAGNQKLRPAVAVQLSRDKVQASYASGIYVVAGGLWSVSGVQSSERLVFLGKNLTSSTDSLTETQSEQLIVCAAMEGRDWLEARTAFDIERAFDVANDTLFSTLYEHYEAYVAEIRSQNEDRVDVQERTLRQHLDSQRVKLETIRCNHLALNRSSLAKATDGRIRKLEERVERKLLELETLRTPNYDYEEICVAVIKVG